MSKPSRKVPKLRFKGFTDDWEQRKLDSIYKKIRNAFVGTATPYYVDSGNFYLQSNNVKDGHINRVTEVFINDEFYEKQKDKWLHTGDLVMVQSGHVGHTAVIPEELDGTAAHALIMFQENIEQIDPYFLNFQFQTSGAQRKLENIATGNTIKHILASEMKKFEVSLPKIEEQHQIGDFFNSIDSLITLHQRKLDALKSLKEAYLQNMFPKKGESVPKVRFANFEGEWEQRKLGEVANIVGGGTPSTTNPDFWGGSIDWYSPIEVGDDTFVNNSSKKITNLGLQKSSARLLPVGTVLFTSRAGIGNTAILAKEGTTNQGFQSIVPIERLLDSYFIFSRTKELKRYGERNGAGSTFIEVSGKQMAKMNMLIPTLNEQVVIGETAKIIDKLIKLQLTKLNRLRLLKKSYLQKMFI